MMNQLLAILVAIIELLMGIFLGFSMITEEEPTIVELESQEATVQGDGAITYLSLNLTAEDGTTTTYMSAYDDEMGSVYVELAGDERKMGNIDGSAMDTIAAEFLASGLAELDGQSVYEEGMAYASMYVEYADGTYMNADYSGVIAEEFINGYEAMENCFVALTEELPVYVPEPVVIGEINADALAAIEEVLYASEIPNLDALAISDVPMDEYFGATVGLTSTDGITSATSCAPMMMATAYSFVVVTVEDTGDIAAVRADFEANLDWNKWVCVSASDAMIAQKDNMVLCVMGSDGWYEQTAAAIEAAGWAEIKTLDNPDM
ncbi:MAG: hypothetical protein IJ468_00745 [Lachnospiraceae bacterium]|nr:hypothetical protein [Lachnospiraceae bacterium]